MKATLLHRVQVEEFAISTVAITDRYMPPDHPARVEVAAMDVLGVIDSTVAQFAADAWGLQLAGQYVEQLHRDITARAGTFQR